jgi:glycosyltransferase involved in cell wall biosynthesis
VTLELEEPIRDVAAEGSRIAWILVRMAGRPRQLLEMPVSGGLLRASEIDERVAGTRAQSVGAEPRVDDARLPPVSVIVPTMLAREAELRVCVDSLLALDYPAYEILLVDNRPPGADGVPAWLRDAPVRLLREPRPGIAAARNRGLRDAGGDIIAFTDDDVRTDPGWLRAYGEHFVRHPGDSCVSGLVMPAELRTEAQLRFEAFYGGGFGEERQLRGRRWRVEAPAFCGIPSVEVVERDEDGTQLRTFTIYAAGTFGAGVNVAFRTTALRAIGGFRPELGTGTPSRSGEDLEVFARLAWRGETLAYEPAAIVYHAHRREHDALRRQIQGYGTGFVAYLLALIAGDPRHLIRIAMTLPRAVAATTMRRAASPTAGARVDAHQLGDGRSRDRELARLELAGMVRGPAAYLASRRTVARRSVR